MKFLSSGGLGDFLIVKLKVAEWMKGNPGKPVDWLHVESNDIESGCLNILDHESLPVEFSFIHDPDYVANLRSYRKGREVIPTAVSGPCDFYKKSWPLDNPFFSTSPTSDFPSGATVIQCSAGANNDRNWITPVAQISKTLSLLGRDVVLIGSDPNFKDLNDLRVMNLVGKISLNEAFEVISRSDTFIGLSGLLNYFACAARVKNIHVTESPRHEEVYYHRLWKKYSVPIADSSLPSVLRGITLLGKG